MHALRRTAAELLPNCCRTAARMLHPISHLQLLSTHKQTAITHKLSQRTTHSLILRFSLLLQLAAAVSTTWSDVRKKLVKLREGMLTWTAMPLHTSLCHLRRGVPRSAPARCHVLLLQLMGDAPIPHGGSGSPATLLAKLLRIATDDTTAMLPSAKVASGGAASRNNKGASELPLVSAATLSVDDAKTVTMHDELYAQLIKQLTRCPSVASLERGWAALRICLHYIRPSDRFENYVESFLRTQQPPPSRRGHHASTSSKAHEAAATPSTSDAMLRLFHRILYVGTQVNICCLFVLYQYTL